MEETRAKMNSKSRKVSRLKEKSMLITAIFLLLSMFTTTSLARETEIPENLIEEKTSSISDVMLAAGVAPSVTITQSTGQVRVDWSNAINDQNSQVSRGWAIPGTYTWTAPEGVTQIKVVLAGAGGGGGRRQRLGMD